MATVKKETAKKTVTKAPRKAAAKADAEVKAEKKAIKQIKTTEQKDVKKVKTAIKKEKKSGALGHISQVTGAVVDVKFEYEVKSSIYQIGEYVQSWEKMTLSPQSFVIVEI